MFSSVFMPFVEESPISVMARGMMERALNPDRLDEWFDTTAVHQYTRDLLFSSVFDLMSCVVLGSHKSVHAAYQSKQIGVSITAVYDKLNGIETEISAGLFRYTIGQTLPIMKQLCGSGQGPLPGKRIKLLDGNCIEKKRTPH